jgi:hypothetical protein
VTPSGLHVDAARGWKHFSSVIKCNSSAITCLACHKSADADTAATKVHINTTSFVKKGSMASAHAYVTLTGIGYVKGTLATDATCTKSCHYNPTDPYGNYTICFKPGQKKRFGAYKTAKWGDTDLLCNECHSTPGNNATFVGSSTTNANKRHADHMFKFKLNPYNFSAQDRNIYCDDCHRTPDINAVRGFQHHTTVGAAGNGIISLPIKSRTSKVYMQWRNNGKGRDGLTAPLYDKATTSCSNVYCHTIMVSGIWTEEACNACHGQKDGTNVGSGAPGYANWTTRTQFRTFESYSGGGGAHYSHVTRRGYACRECHYDGGGDGNPANHHNVLQRTVKRQYVNVGVAPQWWFNNKTSIYDLNTRACNNVSCHYGASQNWDCDPLH